MVGGQSHRIGGLGFLTHVLLFLRFAGSLTNHPDLALFGGNHCFLFHQSLFRRGRSVDSDVLDRWSKVLIALTEVIGID